MMTDDWPQETSRTRLEVSFGPTRGEALLAQTVYHPDERASIVREITDTGRLWVQSVEHGPRDTVIPMTQVGSVGFWRMTT